MAPPGRGPRFGAPTKILLCVLLVNQILAATNGIALEASEKSPPLASSSQELPPASLSSRSDDSQQMAAAAAADSASLPADNKPAEAAAAAGVGGNRSESQEIATSQQQQTTAVEKQPSDKGSGTRNTDEIQTLLASKNDSENDLAAFAKPSSGENLDAPVETEQTKRGVGNRFHYSLGSTDSVDATTEQANQKSGPETTTTSLDDKETDSGTTTLKSTSEVFELHEDSKEPTRSQSSSESAAAITTVEPLSARPQSSSETEVKYDEKTKSIVIESPLEKKARDEPKPETTTSGSREATVETTTAASSKTTTSAPTVSSTATMAAKSESTTEAPKVKSSPEPSSTSSAVAAPVLTTTTTTTDKSPSQSSRPVDVPSVVAAAVGSAIGSAVGAAVKPILTNRGEKSTTVTTDSVKTTSKPSTTTLKSSSDKWNRWNPSTPSISSSSVPPSTRRRPILPSIRRRFRPYNRLTPWGVDSYNPSLDSDYTPYEPSSSSQSSRPSSPTTLRPKRRSSTTEPPRSSSSRPGYSATDSEDEDYSPERPTSSRRGENGPGRRRQNHNHNHNHDRDHRHHNRNHHDNSGDQESFGGHDHGQRRRYNGNNHGHNRHFGRESDSVHPFGSSSADIEPSFLRPNMEGFSLFNSGPTGSGFDLLNPFSWLDSSNSNNNARPGRGPGAGSSQGDRPVAPSHIGSPSRLPGREPIPVEGEYSDRPLQGQPGRGRDTHIHVHGGSGRPIVTGIGNDRDDGYGDGGNYGGHHGHDCHDHDYDHDHHDHHRDPPYRPGGGGRPGRDPHRPYGGEDSYSGGRPNRPYNRRDESELGSTGSSPSSTSSSSSSSSSSNSHDKRERERGHESEPSPSLLHSARSPSSSSAAGPPRRVSSILSPFESLFGALDDDLFNMRSTYIDGVPPRPSTTFKLSETFADTIISSPKISMPPTAAASEVDKSDRAKKPAASDDVDEDSRAKRQMSAFG